MCLIIVKPKNRRVNNKTLANANKQNPHGWGLLAKTDNGIVVERGFDTNELVQSYNRHKNEECVIHMRWATRGVKTIEMTHPFEITTDAWLFHNGIIRNIEMLDDTKSDTWTLANMILRPVFEQSNDIMNDDLFFNELANRIKVGYHNKLVVVTKESLRIINEQFGLWFDGCWYSNDDSFTPRQITQMNYRHKVKTNRFAKVKDSWDGRNPWYCGLSGHELAYVRNYIAKNRDKVGYEQATRDGRKSVLLRRNIALINHQGVI